MFGYVNIYKDELKIKDYNVWKSFYCGLCKKLGKEYNNIVRFGLNYDMTFLALLISSVIGEDNIIKKERCIIHPITKRFVSENEKSISYAAAVSIVLTKEKLNDNINDDKKISSFLLRIPYIFPYKKAEIFLNTIKIKKLLLSLYDLEKKNCRDIDEISDKFALIMAEILSPSFIDIKKREILYSLGYNLGKWIYTIDAVNDYSDDKKKNKYNPFSDLKIDQIEFSLTYTLSQIGKYLNKLNLEKNKALIENIIYLGLISKQDNIINKVKGELKNESL